MRDNMSMVEEVLNQVEGLEKKTKQNKAQQNELESAFEQKFSEMKKSDVVVRIPQSPIQTFNRKNT